MKTHINPLRGLGCGDNSCILGPPGGMGTNGGCRCIPGKLDIRIASEAREIRQRMMRWATRLREQAKRIEELEALNAVAEDGES